MSTIINYLRKAGKFRTAEIYLATLRSFKLFNNNRDILLKDLNSEKLILYESFLLQRGVVKNTSSFYMRVLRAVYNKAVENCLIKQNYPFKCVYTGIDKTIKRAISIDVIRKIKELDLSDNYSLSFARDMFLFSFYTRGMSFVDMAYLKKKNLKSLLLTYRRKKTGQVLAIRWEKCMQDIVDKYESEDSPFLLPIIINEDRALENYRSALHLVNHKLKIISYLVASPYPLSMYVARHSWASIAKDINIPIAIISEGMGHNSERTTQIYLNSLNASVVDNANLLIINEL